MRPNGRGGQRGLHGAKAVMVIGRVLRRRCLIGDRDVVGLGSQYRESCQSLVLVWGSCVLGIWAAYGLQDDEQTYRAR